MICIKDIPYDTEKKMDDVNLEEPRGVVEARPSKCIDRIPSAWALIGFLAMMFGLVTYVILSATGQGDKVSLITAAVVCVVLVFFLGILNWVRIRVSPASGFCPTRRGARKKQDCSSPGHDWTALETATVDDDDGV